MADVALDILKVAVLGRHSHHGSVGHGFVKGFGLRRGAIASSVGHDSHNVCVIGCNDSDMAVAVNRLIEIKGGFVAAVDGKVTAELALPVAGLMSDKPFEEVEQGLRKLRVGGVGHGHDPARALPADGFPRSAGDPASAHHRQGAGRRRQVRVGCLTATVRLSSRA